MLTVYTILLYVLTPFLALSLLLRSLRAPDYRRRIMERFGVLPESIKSGYIWVHSVSVGETVAITPLVKALIAKHPDKPVLVTTMTPTGSEQVQRSFGGSVDHVYAPYDLPGSVARFLRRTQPCIAIIMETELWPNTLRHCDKQNIPAVLVNARMSENSANGYARVGGVTKMMLNKLSGVAVQGESDRQRFIALGLEPQRLSVTGSIKFDYSIDEKTRAATAALRELWQGVSKRPVWIAASTHQGEDEIILSAHEQLLASNIEALLILVPRHPERFEDVYQLCKRKSFNTVRRSSNEVLQHDTQVVLGDTMGELAALYGACDIAFIGGSLVSVGGHNPIEPAAWGLPVLCGPHMFNFEEISAQLAATGGLETVRSAEEIVVKVGGIVSDQQRYKEGGAANLAVVESSRGAMQQQLQLIEQFIE